MLSKLLNKHYNGKKVYILVDEYETPLNNAYICGYVDSMTVFIKNFLSTALKSNRYLQKGVITGILRISKDTILSGLNNLEVFSIFSEDYAPYFGFLESEVNNLFSQYGSLEQIAGVKKYYNGYRIGNCMLYNPWSIINCLKNRGLLDVYWINTANDALLKDTLLRANPEIKEQLQQFLLEPQKNLSIPLSDTVRFDGLTSDETAFWSLLLATGYMTAHCDKKVNALYHCELRVPNKEVHILYLHVFKQWLREKISNTNYNTFMQDLLSGNIDDFIAKLESYLLTYGTSYEFHEESNYHTFMLGLFAGLVEHYDLYSNPQSGFGRADLMLVPKNDQSTAVILELKHKKGNRASKHLAKKALAQIDDKKYAAFLSRYKKLTNILKIGIAFANRSAASCYRWENTAGDPIGKSITHRSVTRD